MFVQTLNFREHVRTLVRRLCFRDNIQGADVKSDLGGALAGIILGEAGLNPAKP